MCIRNLGINKGKRRLWIESGALEALGVKHGMRFDADAASEGNELLLTVYRDGSQGKRKVAGDAARPIIDMTGGIISKPFGDIDGDIKQVKISNLTDDGQNVFTILIKPHFE